MVVAVERGVMIRTGDGQRSINVARRIEMFIPGNYSAMVEYTGHWQYVEVCE